MTHLLVPDNRPLTFYLATEEFLADQAQPDGEELFFTWSVDPTVIIGRHQVLENEVDLPYCHKNGIQIVRRKSGGGAVYSDRGNLMLSFVTPQQHPQTQFERFLTLISGVLKQLGLPAVTTAHNDILVNGRKVSGNALFSKPTGTIVHGTLLLDSDVDELQRCLTPPKEKLQKHGVQSVRQRVITLHELGCTDDARTLSHLHSICSTSRRLTDQEIEQIQEIEKTFVL